MRQLHTIERQHKGSKGEWTVVRYKDGRPYTTLSKAKAQIILRQLSDLRPGRYRIVTIKD